MVGIYYNVVRQFVAERPKVEFKFIGEGIDWSQLPLWSVVKRERVFKTQPHFLGSWWDRETGLTVALVGLGCLPRWVISVLDTIAEVQEYNMQN